MTACPSAHRVLRDQAELLLHLLGFVLDVGEHIGDRVTVEFADKLELAVRDSGRRGPRWCRRTGCAGRPGSPGRRRPGRCPDSTARRRSARAARAASCTSAQVDEAVDLAVAVAGQVGDDAARGRLLVEPVDRHDREQLVDRPGVGQRLEHARSCRSRCRPALARGPRSSSGTSLSRCGMRRRSPRSSPEQRSRGARSRRSR